MQPKEPIRLPPKPPSCELCRRPVASLTKHHLIPRRLHRKKSFQRKYDKATLVASVIWVCRPCHSCIHRAADEKTLGLCFNSVEKLLSIPEVREFVAWLATKPDSFVPKGRGRRS